MAKRELFTAVVGDVMDKLGLIHQFLPPRIKPIRPDMVMIGVYAPALNTAIALIRNKVWKWKICGFKQLNG